jgi:hypothetical protein
MSDTEVKKKKSGRSGKAIRLTGTAKDAQLERIRLLGAKHGVDVDTKGSRANPNCGGSALVRVLNAAIKYHNLPINEIGEGRIHEMRMGRSAPHALAMWESIPVVPK